MKFKQFLFSVFLVLIFSVSAFAYNKIELGPEYFPLSSRGRPISLAYIYVGLPDTDPEIVVNQKSLFVQEEDGTIVEVAQPIRTSAGGIPLYDDAPVTLLVDGDYSLKILNSSGSQIYYVPNRSWDVAFEPGNYYYPDYLATDQGVTGNNNTIKYYVDTIGATEIATIYLKHNEESDETTYTLSTNETISSNIAFVIEPGAIIDIDGGVTLTIGKMDSIERFQKFSGVGLVNFEANSVKEIYPDWWTTNTIPKTTDMTAAVQAAIIAAIPNNIPVFVSSIMLLTASVDIDRAVDGLAYDEYFEIVSHSGGGFYVSTAIAMFSSSFAFAASPVSQLIFFDGIYFESSNSALAAYVLDDSRFLRTQFHNCSFSKIKCLLATIYTQTIGFHGCNMRRWIGTFYASPHASYDIHFTDIIAEAGELFAALNAPSGCSIDNSLIEGMTGTAITYSEAQGFVISGSYFEGNGGVPGLDIAAGGVNYGVVLLGNRFSPSLPDPGNPYSVVWSTTIGGISIGNFSTGNLHDLAEDSDVFIKDSAQYSVANRDLSIDTVGRVLTLRPGQEYVTNGTAWTGAAGATPPDDWISNLHARGTYTITDSGDGAPYDICLSIAVNAVPDADPGINYIATVVENKWYKFSFAFKEGDATRGEVSLGNTLGGVEYGSWAALTDAAWTTHSIIFQATDTAAHISVQVISGVAAEYELFDTFLLTELPIVIDGDASISGNIIVETIPIFANNAAALTGGVPIGGFYRVNDAVDPEPIYIVH